MCITNARVGMISRRYEVGRWISLVYLYLCTYLYNVGTSGMYTCRTFFLCVVWEWYMYTGCTFFLPVVWE